jgi:hypothetical protein
LHWRAASADLDRRESKATDAKAARPGMRDILKVVKIALAHSSMNA